MQIFLAFVVALSVTGALIPILARVAPSIGLTDAPGPRKVHSIPVPRVGGLAMAAGFLAATFLTVDLTAPISGLLLGVLVLLLFGVWDDRATLGYGTKFAGQVLAVGLCMVVGRVHIGTILLGQTPLPPVLVELITFVFLVGVTNAVNLADGLDGLAGGLVLLCLCAVALFATMSGSLAVTAVALIEAGAVLGFLRFNTHPARIFMGDSGSQILGFSVGVLALLATQGEACPLSPALPLLLLGLPITDTLTVMLTRIRQGRSPFSADRNHLHHRLLTLGFAHREAVLLIYILQVLLVLIAYFLRFESDLNVLLAFCLFATSVLALLGWATRRGGRLPQLEHMGRIRRQINTTSTPRLPALALIVMTSAFCLYAATVLAWSHRVELDLGLLCLGMLVVLVFLSTWRTRGPLQWFERVAAYISVVLLVYLDQTVPHKPHALIMFSWTLVGIIAAAAIVRFSLSSARRFELTTLDLIVIFIALVLPNLPGSVALPTDLPGGIAKAVVLLYVVEMLLTVDFSRMVPRLFLFVTLSIIAGRALLAITA